MNRHSYPGDVDSNDYLEHCPAPAPVQANLMGIVGQTITPSHITDVALRSFEVKTHVWDPTVRVVSFTLNCLFPNTPRWQNTPMPRRGGLVHVTGEIVGRREDTDQVVVLIQAIHFISTQGTEAATPEGSPSNTPHKSKWMAWQSRGNANSGASGSPSTTTGKKRAGSVIDLDGDLESVASPSKKNGDHHL